MSTPFIATTKAQAKALIAILDRQVMLAHGEYSRPDYKAVKHGGVWAIHQTPHYYEGTINRPAPGLLPLEDWHAAAIEEAALAAAE